MKRDSSKHLILRRACYGPYYQLLAIVTSQEVLPTLFLPIGKRWLKKEWCDVSVRRYSQYGSFSVYHTLQIFQCLSTLLKNLKKNKDDFFAKSSNVFLINVTAYFKCVLLEGINGNKQGRILFCWVLTSPFWWPCDMTPLFRTNRNRFSAWPRATSFTEAKTKS